MEDKNIIKLLWQRSESAIEALSKRFGKRLMWIAMNILGTVSADNRTLFLRRYWFGDSVKAIAKDLCMRENAASVRLGRIRMQLREYLMKEGYVNE